MKDHVRALLDISSPSLVREHALLLDDWESCDSRLLSEWGDLLRQKNGFYCFESAPHVFPSRSSDVHAGLDQWNMSGLWRADYSGLDRGACFVAKDIFGNQFCLIEGQICTFDAETGEIKEFCRSVLEWSRRVLESFNLHTGYPLAHAWQTQFGALSVVPAIGSEGSFRSGWKVCS